MAESLTTERGCGTRTMGGIYAECPLGEYGEPLEYFLFDPPKVMAFDAMGVPKRGVMLFDEPCDTCKGTAYIYHPHSLLLLSAIARGRFGIEESPEFNEGGSCPMCEGKGGLTHVYDWIGEANYAMPADYLEEVRALGMSRKLSPSLDYSRLSRGSRVFQIHARGSLSIDSFLELAAHESSYLTAPARSVKRCPKGGLPGHRIDAPGGPEPEEFKEVCARLHWQLVAGGSRIEPGNDRLVSKLLPCRRAYAGLSAPPMPPFVPEYHAALICWFPITRLVVIEDKQGDGHKKSLERASAASVPVELEEA